jgi:hypothetical protein
LVGAIAPSRGLTTIFLIGNRSIAFATRLGLAWGEPDSQGGLKGELILGEFISTHRIILILPGAASILEFSLLNSGRDIAIRLLGRVVHSVG